MKLNYNSEDGRMHVELAGESIKDIFERLSEFQEVFECDTACGCCNSASIRFLARTVDEYKFYELSCRACSARLSFGQQKKGGGLFPKRKDEDGNWMLHRGWAKFTPKGEAVGNGPVAAPASAKPAMPQQNGIHAFANWDDAENSQHWMDTWLVVEGVKYKLVDGQYRKAA